MSISLPPSKQLSSQDSWLLKNVLRELEGNQNTYTKLSANFINGKSTPSILRIIKFLKVTGSNDLTVVLADSTHKIFAKFPFKPTIVNFENTYNQRITDCTTNSLVLVQKAELLLLGAREIKQNYDDLISGAIDYLVLNILQLEIYQRDQIVLSSDIHLKYIYQSEEYWQLCKHKPFVLDYHDDGVI